MPLPPGTSSFFAPAGPSSANESSQAATTTPDASVTEDDGFWADAAPITWDTLGIGSVIAPGIAKVTIKGGNKIDRKGAKGQHAETITFQGGKSKDVAIEIRVWDKTTFPRIRDLLKAIEPELGKKDPEPLFIIHPMATLRNVESVVIEEVDGPEWDYKSKWYVIKIKAIEWRVPPKKNATGTPKGAAGGGFVDTRNKAQFDMDTALGELAHAKTAEELAKAASDLSKAQGDLTYAPPSAKGEAKKTG